MYPEVDKINKVVSDVSKIVIIQADNPDGDSLGSALFLEQVLHDMGKEPYLFCSVDMPGYLHYLSGWDRVQNTLPTDFDASIIVDASTITLLDKLESSRDKGSLLTRPCIVIDHHDTVESPIPFATVTLNDSNRASTGELLYLICTELEWNMSVIAKEFVMTTILSDTQGLTNELASSESYRIMAELIDSGVDRPKLEELRRELSKMPPDIFKYKATLIDNTELHSDGRVATVTVPQVEINKYSPLYNPVALIQNDMLQTLGVKVAVVFKTYADGKITGAIRCNTGSAVAAKIALNFGGGGHKYASGFKIQDGRIFNDIKNEFINLATKLLNETDQNESL